MAIEELKILSRLLPGLKQTSSVTVGPGDDCAVLRLPGGETELLAATDQLVRDVHYLRDTPPRLAGAKLVKRNLSDIAAMGGTPRWALLTAAVSGRTPEWVLEFCRGAAECAEEYSVSLVGGDLSGVGADTEVATLTILGDVPAGQAVLRSGAHAGDMLYVTGHIGNSFRSGHHLTFIPRLREGNFLRGKATAMLDVSDGLLLDAKRLAEASRADLVIEPELIPLRSGAALPNAMGDGEDYELLFTAPAGTERNWPPELAMPARIGAVRPGTGKILDASGTELKLERSGYEH